MLSTYILIAKFAILAVSFALSAFFSGSETALFGLPDEEIDGLEDTSGGRAVAHLLQNPRRLLSTILLGNNLVNVLFFSVSFMLILRHREHLGPQLSVALAVVTPLSMIIFCEVLPKSAAVTYRRRWSRLAAPPIYYCQRALWPFIRGLELLADAFTGLTAGEGTEGRITYEELHMLIQHSKQEGGLDIDLGDMMGGVLALSKVEADELMVPRVEMVAFEIGGNPDELLELFRKKKLTLIPVYEGHMDNIIGAVHIKDILFRHSGDDLRTIAREVPFVPETASGEDLLHRFRQEETKTALVIDEYGGVRGLVTIEDILEEIVGEITDEYEERPSPGVRKVDESTYRLRGDMGAREWAAYFHARMPDLPVETVGGLVMGLLDKVPQPGDRCRYDNLEFIVETTSGKRVTSVLVKMTDLDDKKPGEVADD